MPEQQPLYRIRPLVWIEAKNNRGWSADAGPGRVTYRLIKTVYETWNVTVCGMRGYGCEAVAKGFADIEDAQRAAEEHWRQQLLGTTLGMVR